MQLLEVSSAVLPIYGSLGAKGLNERQCGTQGKSGRSGALCWESNSDLSVIQLVETNKQTNTEQQKQQTAEREESGWYSSNK
jgi:hypothetical protein